MRSGIITVKANRRKAEIIGAMWTESPPFGYLTKKTDYIGAENHIFLNLTITKVKITILKTYILTYFF